MAWHGPLQTMQQKRCKLPPVAWGLHGEKTPTAFHCLHFTLELLTAGHKHDTKIVRNK